MINRPFKIYRASAGSGKTYTLVKEYLTLCFNSGKSDAYREILAVTFTNKAANEMKHKILSCLRGIMDGDGSSDNLKKDLLSETGLDEKTLIARSTAIYTNIIHNYSDFNVSTIDSFVQHLSRSFAKELGLPNKYSVLLDDDDLIDEVLQRIGNEISNENELLIDILTEFLNFQLSEENNWRIEYPIRNFTKKLLKETAYNKGNSLCVNAITKQQYEDTNAFLKNGIDSIDKNIDNYIKNIEHIENQYDIDDKFYFRKDKGLPSIKNNVKKQDISSFNKTSLDIIDNGAKWYSPDAKKSMSEKNLDSIGQVVVNGYADLVHYCKDNSSKYLIYKEIKKNLHLYVLRFYILDIINQYIAESSQVHISEFNKRISDIIGNCSVPFIYERIGEKYHHYFIDEFQDTSVLQWQNFLPLIYNSLANGNMNLLVGDAKQSIYRFRSGEVEQLISLPKIFKKPDYQDIDSIENTFEDSYQNPILEYNYRSSKNVINFNNAFFTLAKNCFEDDFLKYKDVYEDVNQKVGSNYKNDGFVSVEIFKSKELKKNDSNKKWKKLYHEIVIEHISKKIKDLQKLGYSYKDITILVRSNKEGSEIANYLNKNQIPVISADSILLKSSDKVQLLIQTLKYFNQNDNPVILTNLLYFKNKCQINNKIDITDLGTKIKELSSQLLSDVRLSEVRDKSGSLYDLCQGLIKIYDFHVIEDIFLQYFMHLIQDWQNNQNSGLAAFLDYWERKQNEFSLKVTGNIDAIQILTIHKAKGLEFNIVFYPFAFTKFPDNSRFTSEHWINCKDLKETEDIPNLDMFLLPIKSNLTNTNLDYLYDIEYNKTKLDDLNIMYVAMTRPVNMLFVYTSDDAPKDSTNIFSTFFNNHTEIKKNEAADDMSDIYCIGECKFIDGNVKQSDVIPLKLNENEAVPNTLDWMSKLKVDPDPSMFWAESEGFMPKEWGTLVHDILSKIKTLDDADKAIAPYLADGTLDEKQSKLLKAKFEEIVMIPEIRDAYSDKALIKNEMSILLTYGGILRPDRYAELDNEIILIDYKTGKMDERHHEQLRSYMIALKNMIGDKKIKAYLVYIGDKIKVIEVFLD